jgi:hypothetical protein
MKRIIGTACLLCGLSAAAQTPAEAVGINTENPRGVLHIDGGTFPNPLQEEVGAAQAADDVVIDASGRIGIGVAAPEAKADIRAGEPKGAIRIADGTEGEGKVLVSGAGGNARWTSIGLWWYAALYNDVFDATEAQQNTGYRWHVDYEDAQISSATQGSVNKAEGTISVPSDGKYRITLCVHYMMQDRPLPYWGVSALFVNGAERWRPSTWGGINRNGSAPTYRTILNLKKNDVLKAAQDQREPFSSNYATGHGVRTFMVELIQAE